jgi:hypothetical protein
MPVQIIRNPVIVLNGGTVSSSATQCSISVEWDDVETTSFGSNGWRDRIQGLGSGSFDVEWNQDYAAGAIDATVWALATAAAGTASVVVRPGSTAAIGTSNPEYRFSVVLTGWNPIDSAVGDLATVSTSWPITGAVTRATA